MRTIKIIVGIILPLTFLLSLLSNDFLAPSTQAAIITPTPTLTPDEADVAKLLTADFRDYCSAGTTSFKCFTPFAVKILDFLYDHPTHQRELLHQIIMLGRQGQLAGNPLNWLVEYWLEQHIRQPFDQAKGIPPGFEANFYLTYQKQRPTSLGEKWGEILTTDLDNNNKSDYLVIILYGSDVTNEIGEMYWLHESRGVYQLTQLPTNFFEGAIYPTEVIIQDVNGDGQLDLIYSVNTCGACHCFNITRIVSWQDNQFVDLLSEDWTTSRQVKVEDEDKDGVFEIMTWPDGGWCSSEGPVLSYHVQHKLHQGQYIPIKQIANIEITSTSPIGWEDLQPWQEAQYLLHSYRLTESLTKFDFMATNLSLHLNR